MCVSDLFHTAVQLRQRNVVRRLENAWCGLVRKARRPSWSRTTLSCEYLHCSYTGIAQFECTVQLVIGLGSTHLPRRAERIWIDHRLCLPLLEKFVIEVRGELNLHLSSSGVMSQVICGHPGRFMLLWCGSSSVRFHRFRCGSPKKEGGFWTRPLRCCRLDVTSLLAQCSLLPSQPPSF